MTAGTPPVVDSGTGDLFSVLRVTIHRKPYYFPAQTQPHLITVTEIAGQAPFAKAYFLDDIIDHRHPPHQQLLQNTRFQRRQKYRLMQYFLHIQMVLWLLFDVHHSVVLLQ
jgi:hypothetical protein